MPVQINEVIIRAVVDPNPRPGNVSDASGHPPQQEGDIPGELMEKIMTVLKEKQER
ncbi:DUF5908 family protein [Niabella soli]|uniref:Uncharacterized protein n=1 Tax=Niabella soli DSM 19437 TaxID=929713 RepID=W0F6M2_9BACT|nr:DUF5908 family protein [Niabella soli]AHF17468.1 hypothetical protein NIASO_08225 [Niabella soli DSM 19437]